MKKLLTCLLVLCLLAGIVPMQSFANAATLYDIWAFDGDYRLVTISPNPAAAGQKVSVTPKAGYLIKELIVAPSDSEPLPLQGDPSGYRFTMPEGNVDVLVFVENENGGGAEHFISLISAGGGNPTVSKTMAAEGETITITPNPQEGCVFQKIQIDYYDETGNVIKEFTTPSFTMPGYDVTVIVYYQVGSGGEQEEPTTPKFEVAFDANSGSCATSSAKVNAQNKLAALPSASRNGYVFAGWYTSKTGGTRITTDTVFTENTTVYAHWVKAAHTTDPDQNAFTSDIDLADQNILNMLVTDDDMSYGEDVSVYLQVRELAENAVPVSDKAAIVSKAGKDEIAAYLDIQLLKKIGSREPVAIRNTRGSVPIAMQLPDTLIPENAVRGSFYIIYYHDGAAKSIPAVFNTASKTLTFNASEFSTYTLVYKTHSDVQTTVPKTGDSATPYVWTLMLLCSSIALAGIVISERKKAR